MTELRDYKDVSEAYRVMNAGSSFSIDYSSLFHDVTSVRILFNEGRPKYASIRYRTENIAGFKIIDIRGTANGIVLVRAGMELTDRILEPAH